jgi:hypothetical protein
MYKTIEYAEETRGAFDLEAEGLNAEGSHNRAEWARMMAIEMKKQGIARVEEVAQCNGEGVTASTESALPQTLATADLAAVEASLDRSRLLLQSRTDVAAMALDAATSIQAKNGLEKMLATNWPRHTKRRWN